MPTSLRLQGKSGEQAAGILILIIRPQPPAEKAVTSCWQTVSPRTFNRTAAALQLRAYLYWCFALLDFILPMLLPDNGALCPEMTQLPTFEDSNKQSTVWPSGGLRSIGLTPSCRRSVVFFPSSLCVSPLPLLTLVFTQLAVWPSPLSSVWKQAQAQKGCHYDHNVLRSVLCIKWQRNTNQEVDWKVLMLQFDLLL